MPSATVLVKIRELFEALDSEGIRYCHWKSNWCLPRTLEGQTDLDVLVHRSDADRFRALLRLLDFAPAIETGVDPLAAVEHHHAKDDATDEIVHVHAYFRVITGESLAKNYHLPVEEMLLAHTRRVDGVVVPVPGAEVIVFVLRMLVKHTTPIELALLVRGWEPFRREVESLMTPAALDEALTLLPRWLPQIDEALFVSAFEAVRGPAPLGRRVMLGVRVRHRMRRLARRHPLLARAAEARKFAMLASHRLGGVTKKLAPGSGGAVIAVVGSEASGKSTVLAEVQAWLGAHFTVTRIHAGKPPATPLTLVPHLLLPLLRTAIPDARSTHVDARAHDSGTTPEAATGHPLAFALRSVMLAHERRALLTRAYAQASNGVIVLSDRYPSAALGAPDGPQMPSVRPDAPPLLRRLSALEARIYADVPVPDLVLHLCAPLDVTLQRNAARAKVEPEEYVRLRHAMADRIDFGAVPTHRVDTDRPLADVLTDVKRTLWDAL